jgi:hypothetical protein
LSGLVLHRLLHCAGGLAAIRFHPLLIYVNDCRIGSGKPAQHSAARKRGAAKVASRGLLHSNSLATSGREIGLRFDE